MHEDEQHEQDFLQQPQPAQIDTCSHCGKQIPSGAVACPYCGKRLVKSAIRKKMIVVGACVVAIVGALVVGIPQYQSHKQADTYNKAVQLLNEGELEDAVQAFDSLEDYSDARQQVASICEQYNESLYQPFRDEIVTYLESGKESPDAVIQIIENAKSFYNSITHNNVSQYNKEMLNNFYTYATWYIDNSVLRDGGLLVLNQMLDYKDSAELVATYSDPDPDELKAGQAIDALYNRLKNPESLVIKGIRVDNYGIVDGYIIYYSAMNGFGAQNDAYTPVEGNNVDDLTPEGMVQRAYNESNTEINIKNAIVYSDELSYY